MIDGYYHVFVDGWPNGYRYTAGFDHLKDGESVLMRLTKHVPKYMPPHMGSLTSEVIPEGPWVIEP